MLTLALWLIIISSVFLLHALYPVRRTLANIYGDLEKDHQITDELLNARDKVVVLLPSIQAMLVVIIILSGIKLLYPGSNAAAMIIIGGLYIMMSYKLSSLVDALDTIPKSIR